MHVWVALTGVPVELEPFGLGLDGYPYTFEVHRVLEMVLMGLEASA